MSVIADVLPTAVGLVLVNPLPVMAIILLLLSPRGAVAAGSFLAGWALGLVGILAVLLFASPLERLVGDEQNPSTFASVVRLLLGVALLAAAVRKWRKRPTAGQDAAEPGWMRSLAAATPPLACGIGFLLGAVNPKNLAFTVSAATAIAQDHVTTGVALAAIVVFVVVGSIGVAAPVVWFAVTGRSALTSLQGWRTWLTANYAVIMTVVFLLFGVSLASRGLGDLLR